MIPFRLMCYFHVFTTGNMEETNLFSKLVVLNEIFIEGFVIMLTYQTNICFVLYAFLKFRHISHPQSLFLLYTPSLLCHLELFSYLSHSFFPCSFHLMLGLCYDIVNTFVFFLSRTKGHLNI